MRLDLGAEPQHKAAAADHLHIVAEIGQVHGIAGKRDGNGCAEANFFGVFSRHSQRQKRVVFGFK